MAGPYLSARLGRDIFFDLRGAWGTSSNTIDPFGLYTDGFDTSRWLTTARLTGNWQFGDWRITPSATVKYGEEHQKSYTDSLGVFIPDQTVSLGRVELGPEVAYRYAAANGLIVEPELGLTGLWDFAGDGDIAIAGAIAGATPSRDRLRGKVQGGVQVVLPSGVPIRASGSYDGIGSTAHAYGAEVQVALPLN